MNTHTHTHLQATPSEYEEDRSRGPTEKEMENMMPLARSLVRSLTLLFARVIPT